MSFSRCRNKPHYGRDESEFPGAYKIRSYPGVAWYVLGWETVADEDTEWSGLEERTGRVVTQMVGDDTFFIFEEEDIEQIPQDAYCPECGQIGCGHGR